MLRLPDECTLRTWSDHSDAPRVLVRCPVCLADEASIGWPAWIGLADCGNFDADIDAIRAWKPDLVVTVTGLVRDSDVSPRQSSIQQMAWLDFGGFDDPKRPQLSSTPWSYSARETANAARNLRESCTMLVGGFLRPGLMCIDFSDLRALVAHDVVQCAVMTAQLTHGSVATTLEQLAARVARSGFQSQAVYSAIKASLSFSMREHDEITAAIELAFPGMPKIGPAVPFIGDHEHPQLTQFALLIAGTPQ